LPRIYNAFRTFYFNFLRYFLYVMDEYGLPKVTAI